MNNIYQFLVNDNEESAAKSILNALEEKKIIYIKNKSNKLSELINPINFEGPAVLLNSSGSSQNKKKCIHPIANLNQSAKFSGLWLRNLGIELENCIIFNTLPLNHISGLMALWRSKVWDCEYINISRKLIKNTKFLFENTKPTIRKQKFLITSLVPTQLNRLLLDKDGVEWLKIFDLIWVGGARLSKITADNCRENKINLSPCYGATETAAMVTSLKPYDFLNGINTVGEPLEDINLRINKNGLIEIDSERIGLKFDNKDELKSFKKLDGWWESGDVGELFISQKKKYLKIIGRADNAFNSGGETIFPDVIKFRLDEFISQKRLPIEELSILRIPDKLWENKFKIALKFKDKNSKEVITKSLNLLKELSMKWPKPERPKEWLIENRSAIYEKNHIKNWKDNF